MNEFKFDMSFRVRHPTMDAKKICVELGLTAKYCWTVGEQRRTPKGDFLEGSYPETYCTFILEKEAQTELADLIKSSNQMLRPHKNFLQSIYSSGGRLEYFIGWYSDGNSGEEFDADLLAEMADLKIGLTLDFYGGKKQ